MTVRSTQKGLLITYLPLEDMALLAMLLPLTPTVEQVLTALLEGKRVAVTNDAFEYKRYRRTASPEVYRRLVAMERQLHQMGLVRATKGDMT